jgi:hypothetical protein
LTQGWSLYPIVSWRTGFPLDVVAQTEGSGDFTSPGVTGAGDIQPFANLTGQPITITDPRGNAGNFYFNPGAFSNAQCPPGSTTTPGQANTCIPSSSLFPSVSEVVANPALRTYGSSGRGILRGPGRTNVDMTFSKTTAITERLKLEIRADVFNLFNHAEFDNPNTNVTSGQFGQITATGDPGNAIIPVDPKERIIQLAVRFTF